MDGEEAYQRDSDDEEFEDDDDESLEEEQCPANCEKVSVIESIV